MAESLFERVGGRAALERVVARFYAGVATDPVLRPLYPDDLVAAEHRLALFLIQFTGGPHEYQAARGHPRLRARHLEFSIAGRERDAWVARMSAALESEVADEGARGELAAALRHSADFLVNAGGLSLRGRAGQ